MKYSIEKVRRIRISQTSLRDEHMLKEADLVLFKSVYNIAVRFNRYNVEFFTIHDEDTDLFFRVVMLSKCEE